MLKLYFRTALRSLLRNSSYSLINLLGLTLGITCSLLIFLVIQFETSYDTFHSEADRIYRLNIEADYGDGPLKTTSIHFPATKVLRENNPGFEQITQVYVEEGGQTTISETGTDSRRHFREESAIAFVEAEFFDFFDFDTGGQDLRAFLREPNNVILTSSLAQKYFPGKNAVGQTVTFNHKLHLKVAAVIPDFPIKTDFPFKLLISYPSLKGFLPYDMDSWHALLSNHSAFAILPAATDINAFEKRANSILHQHMPNKRSTGEKIITQPLLDIHFNKDYGNYSQRTISKEVIWSMGLVGILLVLTACINFINLATALAVRRSKEIGIRKVMGSNQWQIMLQFLGETLVITLVATLTSVILAELALPYLNELLGLQITFSVLQNPTLLFFLVLQVVLVTLLAGLYPAFQLAHFQPIVALRSRMSVQQVGGLSLRRALVVFQFIICQVLIICTLIVNEQMRYFRNKDLGFDKDAIVSVLLPRDDALKLKAMRAELLNHQAVSGISFGLTPPSSDILSLTNFRFGDEPKEAPYQVNLKLADENYLDLFDIKLVAGRRYTDHESSIDSVHRILINETLRRKLGLSSPEQALGQTITFHGGAQKTVIVGVVEDFHLSSLRSPIDPAILFPHSSNYLFMMAKIDTRQSEAALAHLEQVWYKAYPDAVFSYEYLDEVLARFYREEARQSTLFKVFSFIAIFIGCLGLYGLIAFMTAQRTKEIGIRKVLGASVFQITVLFSKEFAKLVLIAFLMAAPIAWFIMNQWLQNFTYHISIGYGPFLLAGAATLLIALITMSTQAIRAAMANPVYALKAE